MHGDYFWRILIEEEHPDPSFLMDPLTLPGRSRSEKHLPKLESEEEFLSLTLAPFLKKNLYDHQESEGQESQGQESKCTD